MTLTLNEPSGKKETVAKAPKRARKPAAKASIDVSRLARLAARIEEMRQNRLDELFEELEADGAQLSGKGQHLQLRLAGITATATAGRHSVVLNWANAARRAVMAAENENG